MYGSEEILSLQFGHYSNFIGAHWWNVQESSFDYTGTSRSEINHDVLYREGRTLKGETTYTPRLLLVDLKDSLNHLSEQGDLYEPISEQISTDIQWQNDKIEVNKKEIAEKIEFQHDIENTPVDALNKHYNFETDVTVWSDYLLTRFHPRTVNCIQDFQHKNTEVPFDIFPLGSQLWQTEAFEDSFSDKIRQYIEECDHFQGFHITLDSVDGFAGLSTSCVQYLQDEYARPILTFPVIPSYYYDYDICTVEQSAEKDIVRLINLALCYDSVGEFSSLFVPLCTGAQGWRKPGPSRNFKYLNYNPKLYYHSSAILAAAMDTFTLQHRKYSNNISLSNVCSNLNGFGRKAAAASLNLPFGIQEDTDLIDCLNDWEGPLWENLTPNCTIKTDHTQHLLTVRGILESQLKKLPHDIKSRKQREMPAYSCESVESMFEYYLLCMSYGAHSRITTVSKPLSTKIPFPKIFNSNVTSNGMINNFNNENVNRIPVIAGLHSGSYIGDMFKSLNEDISRVKFSQLYQFTKAGLERDDYKECLERLQNLKECYDDN